MSLHEAQHVNPMPELSDSGSGSTSKVVSQSAVNPMHTTYFVANISVYENETFPIGARSLLKRA